MLKKIAVVSPQTLGDGYLLLIAANNFACQGYHVNFYHEKLKPLASWLPNIHFCSFPLKSDYDLILIESNNTEFIQNLICKHRDNAVIIYPSYKKDKHLSLASRDYICDKKQTMADNILSFCQKLLPSPCHKNIGLQIPLDYQHRKNPKRVIIHPFSTDPRKNWFLKKFHKLATKLSKAGYEVVFPDIRRPLTDFMRLVYESGYVIGNDSMAGHMASLLDIPYMVIAASTNIPLWSPGWHPGLVLTPSKFLLNCKGLRLKTNHWQHFISVSSAFKSFQKMASFSA